MAILLGCGIVPLVNATKKEDRIQKKELMGDIDASRTERGLRMGKTTDKTVFKSMGFIGHGTGSSPVAVDIKDGRIARMRPFRFDAKYTEEELKPWTLEARGHTFECGTKALSSPLNLTYKQRTYSKNRIPYPLKRVDFDPDGERNVKNRGTSGYVRISWDEAAEITAKEIRRCVDEYGPSSVFLQPFGHGEEKVVSGGHGIISRLMDLLGGYTVQARQPDSWEGWYWGAKHAWGMDPYGKQAKQSNLFKDISENSQAVLFWGCDYDTTPYGWGGQIVSKMSFFWTEIGVKQIFICPDVNYACAVHADKWIPVLPNTDAALQLAIAYTWISENTYDREYLDTHSVGFDNFSYYVMGGEDGVPKTPKWAEKRCGVPSRQIKALARYWAKNNISIGHCNGGGFIRSTFSHEPGRLEVCLLAMQALGHPGRNQLSLIEWGVYAQYDFTPMPRTSFFPSVSLAYTGYMPGAGMRYFIPQTLVPKCIVEGKADWWGHVCAGLPREDQFGHYEYPAAGGSRIHMIYSDSPCWSTCWNGGYLFQDALRDESIEFVVVEHQWMENDTFFADIILPATTKLEDNDIASPIMTGQFDMVFLEDRAIDPIGEAKSDVDCVLEIAKHMGLYDALMDHLCFLDKAKGIDDDDLNNDINGMSREDFERFFSSDASKEMKADFESLKRLAYKASGVEDKFMDWETFKEKGYVTIPVVDDWRDDPAGLIKFYEDPDGNPLSTPTGKIEFYATGLADNFPDDELRPPVPHWIEDSDWHHERLINDRGKDYPFLLVSNHPHFRVHAQNDDNCWLREIHMCKVIGPDGYAYEPIWMNPNDARKRNIKDGDICVLFNERGAVMGGVIVTERIMEGSLSQDHGARCDTIVTGAGGLDRGGANNLICPNRITSPNAAGEVTNGFLVNIEKVDVFELAKKYPEQFNRPYDVTCGLVAENRIIMEG